MAFWFYMARSSLGRFITYWIFAHMSFAIPIQHLRETNSLIAFHHPKPGHPVHILLVPKKAIGSLIDLKPTDADFLMDLFSTVHSLVTEFDLQQAGYCLIINGGKYQDMPQIHFHLISNSPLPSEQR
jgi:histidine triad (HIT) family protein